MLDPAAVGKTDDTTVVAGMDILPSLLTITGVAHPAAVTYDGEDVSAAMLGKPHGPRATPVMWSRPPDRPGPPDDFWPDLAIRQGDVKLLIDTDGKRPHLYDLAHDPREATDLAAQKADVVAALSKTLMTWFHSMPPTTVPPRPANPPAKPPYMKDDGG